MKPQDLIQIAIAPALSLLPDRMDTPAARAMLVAIALQESGLRHRQQIRGPARGLWQFERIGVTGVQTHHATSEYAAGINQLLLYRDDEVYPRIEDNDILAAAYARLLLWRDPRPLPDGRMDVEAGWTQYRALWGPGRPHQDTWNDHYLTAWSAVGG